MKDDTTEKTHSFFMNGLLIVIGAPLLFLQWLLFNEEFGAGKAIIFVIVAFLFGSAFFF